MKWSTRGSGLVLVLALVSLLSTTLAIQANLAGIIDWHKPLIGAPLLDPSPPSIVEFGGKKLVVGITKKNVLAVLNGKEGEIAWRYLLEDDDPVVSYHVQDDYVLLLSGPSATTARLFSLTTGQVQWEKQLHDFADAKLTTPIHLGTDATFTEDSKYVVILSNGRRVIKLGVDHGNVEWSLDAPGVGDTVLFKQLLVSGESVHILALTSSFTSTTLTTLSLSLSTSAPLGDFTQIPSFVSNPAEAFIAAGDVSGTARVLWQEHGRIRSAYLSAAGQLGNTKDLMPGKGHLYAHLLDVGLRRRGFVLGQKTNGAVQIVDIRAGAKVVGEFEKSNDSADKSPSVYAGAASSTGVTFNRVFWNFAMNLAVSETFTVTNAGDAISTGFTFPFDTTSHGVILGAAVTGSVGPGQLPEIVLTTSSDSLQFVTQQKTVWTREESLADLAAVKSVDLGERQVEEAGHVLAEEDFIGRTTRHLAELKELPGYLFRFAQRFASASYTTTLHTPALNSSNLHSDQFGFQKLLVAVTKGGKVFALDSSTGNTLWTKNLGLTSLNGPELLVEGLWLVREVGEGVNPTLAVLAMRTRDSEVYSVGFHIDAFTGEIAGDVDAKGLPKGKELFHGRSETAFLTPFENCGTNNRVLAVVDGAKNVHIFPSCKKVAGNIAALTTGLSFTTTSSSLSGSIVSGHTASKQVGTSFNTTSTWSISFAPGEQLYSSTPSSFGTISSYGRVLGDKSTLYKYLNPHLIVVSTITPALAQANIYVIDSTTGRKIHSALIKDVVTDKGVKVTMSENWLVYAWLDKNGWRIGSTELYEDLRYPKQSPETPGISSFVQGHDVIAYGHVFIAPSEIKAMETTTSKFGITAKELVYVNGRNQIAAIPRRLLDPRRPVGKPSSSDKEEMLIPYEPYIPPEPKRVISHQYQILGATSLTSSPALVESTSLLFVHGLDLFSTRGLNPSGTFDILTDSFNKAQLLLTLAGLSVGILIAKPAVQMKALKAKWF